MTEELTCPICKKVFRTGELLNWHAFLHEMKPVRRTRYELEPDEEPDPNEKSHPIINRCWCGKTLSMLDYNIHLNEHRGAALHYHASMIGVEVKCKEQ